MIDTILQLSSIVQPAVSTAFSAVIATLFLRQNTSKAEIEKLKQAKFDSIADALLSEGYITHLEYYKCRNFEKIAKKADIYFQQKQVNDDKNHFENEIDIDWFVRFFEDSGNISNEKIQEIWAKILSEELNRPGSFERRTLDILKNLNQYDASLFQQLTQYVMRTEDSCFIMNSIPAMDKYGINRSDITYMHECGLIRYADFSEKNSKQLDNYKSILFYTDNFVCIVSKDESHIIKVNNLGYSLAKAGKELYSIIKEPSNLEYIKTCVDFISKHRFEFDGLRLSLHRITIIENSKINYENTPLHVVDCKWEEQE